MNPDLINWSKKLFECGLEGYDATQAGTDNKGFTNLGGAKLFYHSGWQSDMSKLVINHAPLKACLASIPALVLLTVNRIQTDADGKPVRVKNGNGFNRTHHGLVLYSGYDANAGVGNRLKELVVNAIKPMVDVSEHVATAKDLITAGATEVSVIEQFKVRNAMGMEVGMKPHATLLMCFPSGPVGGNAFWSYKTGITNRAAAAERTTASASETNDIPF